MQIFKCDFLLTNNFFSIYMAAILFVRKYKEVGLLLDAQQS